MSNVVCDVAVSMDGYMAGPGQTRDLPFGRIEHNRLYDWMIEDGAENRDEFDAMLDAGAFIMGRNMFGPDRGEWDLDWSGWWGDEPLYHAPVFVLAHRERPDLAMAGGAGRIVRGAPEVEQRMRLVRAIPAGDLLLLRYARAR